MNLVITPLIDLPWSSATPVLVLAAGDNNAPIVWFLDRASGLVSLVLLTIATALGVLATRGRAGHGLPAFVMQTVHRNASLLGVGLLIVHLITAVAHDFVDIRWWDLFVPFGSAYEPLLVGLGALSVDLMLVIVVTSLIRDRLNHTVWRAIHVSSYAAWLLGVAHGYFLGTDTADPRGLWALITLGCVAVVALAALVRVFGLTSAEKEQVA